MGRTDLHVPFDRPVKWIAATRYVVGGEKANCKQRRTIVRAQSAFEAKAAAALKLQVAPGQVEVWPMKGWT